MHIHLRALIERMLGRLSGMWQILQHRWVRHHDQQGLAVLAFLLLSQFIWQEEGTIVDNELL